MNTEEKNAVFQSIEILTELSKRHDIAITTLEDRVKELEQENERRESYEQEMRERE
jgi:hypothetical protein